MQPRAWYIHPPTGKPYGPCFTRGKAQMEAARIATGRPKLEGETALIRWRSLHRKGWGVQHTGTKMIRPSPDEDKPTVSPRGFTHSAMSNLKLPLKRL